MCYPSIAVKTPKWLEMNNGGAFDWAKNLARTDFPLIFYQLEPPRGFEL